MTAILDKRIFLIVSPDPAKCRAISHLIRSHVSQPTIYTAPDGSAALLKLENVPPHIVVTDLDLPTVPGTQLVDTILARRSLAGTVVIIAEPPPEREAYIDELVVGKVLFASNLQDEAEFTQVLFRALNFVSHERHAEFYIRFIAKGQVLLKEGDKGDVVFILRQGRLCASRTVDGTRVELGFIEPGEFVGEMSYIQGQPRSADVEALSDCELIEVPVGTLERVLYRRPAWSRALMLSLSKRLASANVSKVPGA